MADSAEGRPAIQAQHISVASIRMIQCRFDVALDQPLAADKATQFEMGIAFQLGRGHAAEPGMRALRLGVQVSPTQGQSPYSAEVVYQAEFGSAPEYDAMLAEFSRYNAVAIVIPYLREAISALSVRAGFPALVLPPVNAVELVNTVEGQPSSADSDD